MVTGNFTHCPLFSLQIYPISLLSCPSFKGLKAVILSSSITGSPQPDPLATATHWHLGVCQLNCYGVPRTTVGLQPLACTEGLCFGRLSPLPTAAAALPGPLPRHITNGF